MLSGIWPVLGEKHRVIKETAPKLVKDSAPQYRYVPRSICERNLSRLEDGYPYTHFGALAVYTSARSAEILPGNDLVGDMLS